MSQVWVVAGNGQSLTAIAPGRVLAHDRILRCNNFFFEERYHLGRRVDLAFIGGDPRVAPFVFETLNRARGQYDIGAWSSPNARVARWGRRYLRQGYRPLRYRDGAVEAEVARLSAKHGGLRPSTGVEALLMAHGEDLGTRSYDLRLHHPELDRALIGWLARREDLALWRAANGTALDDLLDLAPMREGPAPEAGPKPQVLDWASWAGWYPIGALKVMRRVRRWQRRLTGGLP
jgi:hypothetical protein